MSGPPRSLLLSSVVFALAVGCSGTEPSDGDGNDDSGAGGGSGSASTGGAATGGGSSGGSAAGGAALTSGGTMGSGGDSAGGSGSGGLNASGGAGTGGQGSGGDESSGGAGTGGDDGAGGGSSSMPDPSAGCSSPGSGDTNVANAIVSIPAGYDGTTPMPLLFAFHGAGRTNDDFRNVDARMAGHAIEDDYIVVYLKSSGNDWTSQQSANEGILDTAFNEVTQKNCVDMNHVFATGHSSGAQFIERLICAGETRFFALAPVAGSGIGGCNQHEPIHELYIHGSGDTVRGTNGQEGVNLITNSNSCGSSTPFDQASSCGGGIDPGCVEYDDCSKRTIWCSHNDPNYSNTNHGWPCFANDAIHEFFGSL